jgi:hypothetical protein
MHKGQARRVSLFWSCYFCHTETVDASCYDWLCFETTSNGLTVATRLSISTGAVECFSTDGVDCRWGECKATIYEAANLLPVVCSAADTANTSHWCGQAKALCVSTGEHYWGLAQ